jgi:hypothetical protein
MQSQGRGRRRPEETPHPACRVSIHGTLRREDNAGGGAYSILFLIRGMMKYLSTSATAPKNRRTNMVSA